MFSGFVLMERLAVILSLIFILCKPKTKAEFDSPAHLVEKLPFLMFLCDHLVVLNKECIIIIT